MLKKYLRYAVLPLLLVFVGVLCISTTAFAATSIKYGWIALDKNKNLILNGSQYQLSSGKATPIQYIFNGKDMKSVPTGAVVYLNNTKTGTAQALIIGDKVIGYKDAFITTFTVVNKPATSSAVNKPATNSTVNKPATSSTQTSAKKNTATSPAKANLSKASVAVSKKGYYTHGISAVTPTPTVKLNNKTLKKGTDYTISYTNSSGKKVTPKKPGSYKIVVAGKGNYTGSKTVGFKLVNMGDDMAKTACKLSYSTAHYYSGGKYPGTKKYLKAFKAAKSSQSWVKGRSCDAGVFTAVKTAKYDSKFPSTCAGQSKYFGYSKKKTTTSKWKYMGKFTGKVSTSNLLPGDVMYAAVSGGGCHIIMYVGKDIPKDVYKTSLKKTDADKGKPTGRWASAHYGGGLGKSHNAALCICGDSWSLATNSYYKGKWKIYRCVKPDKASGKSHGGAVK